MSKKEQKLKKNLYKALTEYFIHNTKNSLASSESILDQLASFRMETGLPLSKEEVFIPNKTNPEDKYRINSRETVNLCR